MKNINIANQDIGISEPCFIVAEIGINHNGDVQLAKKMIDAAVDVGANSVKFQNYRTNDFVLDRSLTHKYVSQGKSVVESQYEMFKRCELSPRDLQELKEYCDSAQIIFHSTPTSETGIDDLVKIGTSLLKNGSDYLTNLPLIQSMGKTNLPTVLSTGMATVAEIDEAVRTFRETGNEQLILLHCTSSYPTPTEEVNLRRIPTLAQVFGCLVGFSDHTAGNTAAIGAVVLGACWIEKHFTLDKNLPGPDHSFSADPKEFKALVSSVRTIEKNLGDPKILPTYSEEKGRQQYRLSCVVNKSLSAGEALKNQDIAFQRPGIGIPPAQAYLLVGRTLKNALKANQIIKLSDLN